MDNRAFDAHFNPSAFLLPNTNFIAGVSRHTKSAVSVVIPTVGTFLTRFPVFFVIIHFTCFDDIGVDT